MASGGSETTPLVAPPPFTLRPARFGDLEAAARVCTLAFWDDALFGHLIHPHRHAHPLEVDKYWYRRFLVDWWDWSHVFLVTTAPSAGASDGEGGDDGDEATHEITGIAHWSRIAPSWRENAAAGYGLAPWDARRLLKPVVAWVVAAWNRLSPNRACDPAREQILESSYGFLDHLWTGERAESWLLEGLAVSPVAQRNGQGRALVRWGLEQAAREGVSCSVITGDGKERFYRRCGFDVGPVGRSGEGEGNPLREVPGGLCFFKDKAGVTVPLREPGPWMYGPGVYDWSTYGQDKGDA